MGSRTGLVEELIEMNCGVAVIDGGLATQLEALGADINDPLWSARCLISDPHLIKQVIHRLFLMHWIGSSLISVCFYFSSLTSCIVQYPMV
ncbi:hypothetical protein BHE74_00023762 [Ensete ventricosum]|nr:hypothetical protein GW17_00006285 [Ensete ventricosum]RWW68715.1 hypothetical protein BHE74_00023762 [Ensete ventricosum]